MIPPAKRIKIDHKSVGFIVYNKISEEVILVKQTKNQQWSFPKGKIETGETDIQTAIRELEEETGLQKNDITCNVNVYIKEVFYVPRLNGYKKVKYYIAFLKDNHSLLSLNDFSEVEAVHSVKLNNVFNGYLDSNKFKDVIEFLKKEINC